QPGLEIVERLRILHVVARDQQLDAATEYAKPALVLADDLEPLLLAWAVDPVLDLELCGGRRRGVLGQRREDRPHELVQAGARCGGDRQHARRSRSAIAPLRAEPLGLARRDQIGLGERDQLRELA